MEKMTKMNFYETVIAIAMGEKEITPELATALVEKANAGIQVELNRKAYAETHPSKSKAKGASDTTKALAKAIVAILGDSPLTSEEIATKLGKPELTPLNISNALRYAGVEIGKTKVKKAKINSAGCRVESLYTAYYLC